VACEAEEEQQHVGVDGRVDVLDGEEEEDHEDVAVRRPDAGSMGWSSPIASNSTANASGRAHITSKWNQTDTNKGKGASTISPRRYMLMDVVAGTSTGEKKKKKKNTPSDVRDAWSEPFPLLLCIPIHSMV
jgi:hypothetical protein